MCVMWVFLLKLQEMLSHGYFIIIPLIGNKCRSGIFVLGIEIRTILVLGIIDSLEISRDR